MNPLPATCPKCNGPFVHGHSVEFTSMNSLVEFWIEGEAKKVWSGVKIPVETGRIPIASLRCSECGYLESYARAEFAAK